MPSPKDLLDPCAWIWVMLIAFALRFLSKRSFRAAVILMALAVGWSAGENLRVVARLTAGKELPYYGSALSNTSITNRGDVQAVVQCGGVLAPSPYDLWGANFNQCVDRFLTAVEAARRFRLPLVLGGGSPGPLSAPAEASYERAWLASWGLTNFQILELGGDCNDTHDEALAAAQLARTHKWKRVLLVTSAIHMDRALAAFRKTGLEVEPLACDFDGAAALNGPHILKIIPSIGDLAMFKLWLMEEVGFYYYRLRGWA